MTNEQIYADMVGMFIRGKVYAPGMPGMKLVTPLCNHAITVDEFMIFWDIYSKYEGLAPPEMERKPSVK